MNTKLTLSLLSAVMLGITSCSDDPEPVNQLPGSFEVTSAIKGNSVTLNWQPAVDPDEDAVTYTVVLNGETVTEGLSDTRYSLTDLLYESAYTGKIIAKDSKGAFVETPFAFTTGFLFLKSYEVDGHEYFLEYDAVGHLINIENSDWANNALIRNDGGKLISLGAVTYAYNSGGLINSLNDGKGEGTILYDSKDRIVRMSTNYHLTPSARYWVTRNHAYNDLGQLIQVEEDTYSFAYDTHYYSRFKLQYDSKGNVVHIIEESSTDNITYMTTGTVTYSYDDKKNPWYRVLSEQTNLNPIFIESYDVLNATLTIGNFVMYRTSWMSANNVTRIRREYSGGFTQREYTYTYNDEGYPTTAEISSTASDWPSGTDYRRWYY